MAQFLKRTQPANDHGVPQMNVGRRGIRSKFYPQGLAGLRGLLQLGAQLLIANDLRGALAQVCELFVDRHRFIVIGELRIANGNR